MHNYIVEFLAILDFLSAPALELVYGVGSHEVVGYSKAQQILG